MVHAMRTWREVRRLDGEGERRPIGAAARNAERPERETAAGEWSVA